MKDWGELIIHDELQIFGRGIVFLIDLKVNNLTDSDWNDTMFFDKGDIIHFKDEIYEIIGVEYRKNLVDKISSNIGIVVKKKMIKK